MADDRTYILKIQNEIIDGGQSDGGTLQTPDAQAAANPQSNAEVSQKKSAKSVATKNAAIVLAEQYAKKGLMDIASHYGEITGDYQTQQTISAGIELGITVAMIAANPLVGGVAAVANYGGKAVSYIVEQKKSIKEAAFRQKRVGYTAKG